MTTKKLIWGLFGILVISAWVLGSAIQAGAQTQVLNDYAAAWNSHDTEETVSFFTDDIVSGNCYCAEWIWSGTRTGNIYNLPATGKRFSIGGVSVGELKEGKIKRNADYYNWMDLLQQIGIKLVPAPPPK